VSIADMPNAGTEDTTEQAPATARLTRAAQLGQILPQHSAVFDTTLVAAGFAISILISLRLSSAGRMTDLATTSIATIWLGNGVQIGTLLLLRRRWWSVCLAGFTVISIALMVLTDRSLGEAFAVSLVNLAEVVIAAFLLHRDEAWISGRSDSLTSWLRFASWGVVLAPLTGTALGVLTLVTLFHARISPAETWSRGHTWYITDALGICIVVPLMLRLRPSMIELLHRDGRLREMTGLMVLLAAMAAVVLSQPSVIALFAITLPLIVLAFRLGFVGLVTGMALLSPLLLGFTRVGHGPFMTMAEGSLPEAVLLAELFLISMFAMVVLIGALLDERQQFAARESANEQVYRMIAATSSDMILVLTDQCAAKYVSPAASELAGRPEHALIGMGWLNQVHAEDRDELYRAFNAVREGVLVEGEAVCRLRRREGDWRWLEFRLRRSRSDGASEIATSPSRKLGAVPSVTSAAGLTVAIVRDVTGRKEHEETLRAENRQLAHEATTDALTGLPNRREFEHRLAAEWRRALRAQQPLSLLVIDVDFFKRYNDTYGHAEGDACLAAVAQVLRSTIRRPSDLCARYGGEEFVALLPNTGRAGGHAVALAVCAAMRRLQIEHSASDLGHVTVSVGSATAVPEGPAAAGLFTQADLALYRAKAGGRDRAEVFTEELDLHGEDDGTGVDSLTGGVATA
jgi:diguanylate cyclase (GGDEF)-like protein/PAS domain S-box-containing protein